MTPIRRIRERLLLSPAEFRPRNIGMSVIGVFNPGVATVDGRRVILARVAEQPVEQREGLIGLPRMESGGQLIVDWAKESDWDLTDLRVVGCKATGASRLTSISHLQVIFFRDGEGDETDREFGPAFSPETCYEEFGVEDPRITEIDGRFWITYVAVSRHGAASALASTDDFRSFVRHGMVFCPENKDVVMFPQKVGESYVALHRPSGSASFCSPEIWLARSPDLVHWGGHQVLFGGQEPWEAARVGAGPPPIALPEGWLVIYHGVGTNSKTTKVGTYSMGAMLLARDDPTRVLGRSREPILIPSVEFERRGFLDNVTFPTGVHDRGNVVEVYYGASDKFIGVVEFAKADVLAAIT